MENFQGKNWFCSGYLDVFSADLSCYVKEQTDLTLIFYLCKTEKKNKSVFSVSSMSFAELWDLADRNGLFGLPWAFIVELQNTRVGNSFSWDFYKCL